MAAGTIGQDDGDGYAPLAEINVTPMVDVMLVLLIIFMVAAPLMMVGVPVELPRTAAAKVGQTRQPLIVSIDRDGKIFVREEAIGDDDTLQARLTAMAAEDKESVVYVRGDKTIAYGRVMEIMGRVGQAGFHKVSLIAEAPRGNAPAK